MNNDELNTNEPLDNTYNPEHSITSDELLDLIVADSTSQETKKTFNIAEDISTNKIFRNEPKSFEALREETKLAMQNHERGLLDNAYQFSQSDIDKYTKQSEEIIAEMILTQSKKKPFSPEVISKLRTENNPDNSTNLNNKPK